MRPIACTLVAALLAGCFGTSYMPHIHGPGELQVTVSQLGSVVLRKQGKEIASGYFDRSVPKAFADHKEAAAHATSWREQKLWSLALSLIGSAITLVGAFTIEPGAGLSGRNAFSVASIVTGSAPLTLASVLCNLAADAHLQDAINLYNDAARKKPMPGPTVGLGPGGLTVRW